MVCGKITFGSHAAVTYCIPFMLLITKARSSLSSAQTSLAHVYLGNSG